MASEDDTPARAEPYWTSDFDGISVGPVCHIQRAESRFGSHVTGDIRDWIFGGASQPSAGTNASLQNQPESSGFPNQGQPSFPKMARYRLNLTALSQRYNMYFAAYQDHIYVYQPQAAPEILPGPSIILHPKRTRAARMFGGVIDTVFPHQVSNMVVGNLGTHEVLLFAYDDGDVGAYYTHTIEHAILANDQQRQERGIPGARPVVPRQFFSENVGKSAWGLAIHEQSRLFAVSSNNHEVTVFAFALNSTVPVGPIPASFVDSSPRVWSGQTAMELQRHFQTRTRTWRVVLPLGPLGQNIPTIAFWEDEKGDAARIIALDINDNTWIMEIWRLGSQPLLIRGAGHRGVDRLTGWGVLVLRDSSFMKVKSVREALGVPADQIIDRKLDYRGRELGHPDRFSTPWLDTTCSLYYVKDLASDPETYLRSRFGPIYSDVHARGWRPPGPNPVPNLSIPDESPDEETEHDTDVSEQHSEAESDDPGTMSSVWPPLGNCQQPLSTLPGPKGSVLDDLASQIQLGKAIIPSFGETYHLDGSLSSLMELISASQDRQGKTRPTEIQDVWLAKNLWRLSILRAKSTDIELISFAPSASVQCRCVVTYHNHHRRPQQPIDLAPHISQRISMLIQVPELNLVVAGSLTGRVALITLTKTKAQVHRRRRLRKGFRVDHVLPRKSDEDQQLRPWCTLHGIAMSPVPALHTTGLELMDTRRIRSGPPPPLRYRLILHYLDHTILMYYIERKGEELSVC
ncbi:hypothetical protein QBC37DRAFT_408219 [Rhypophila decipiens]|uniref:Pyridine nucleotide-disulfide oxidoreductase family protein n=1 Tax=Rhypophila decipiens TaxID=261697 RepID=A0AAN7BDS0_9PEZI|nr:hypothetical protein QBC37DRAFT_408219 [Rhypophila decipiens]